MKCDGPQGDADGHLRSRNTFADTIHESPYLTYMYEAYLISTQLAAVQLPIALQHSLVLSSWLYGSNHLIYLIMFVKGHWDNTGSQCLSTARWTVHGNQVMVDQHYGSSKTNYKAHCPIVSVVLQQPNPGVSTFAPITSSPKFDQFTVIDPSFWLTAGLQCSICILASYEMKPSHLTKECQAPCQRSHHSILPPSIIKTLFVCPFPHAQ